MRFHCLFLAAALGLSAPSADAQDLAAGPDRTDPAVQAQSRSILLFTRTQGFRHGSIANGISTIQQIVSDFDPTYTVDTTEDPTDFNAGNLAGYDAVVFLNTSGDVLNNAQQAAFEGYIQAGGGYMGVHAASDTEYNWPWYGEMMGAWFNGHPAIQQATLSVEAADHPATQDVPATWVRTDEWYNFRRNPREDVKVLVTIDEDTYNGGNMGADHPIAWCHDFDGGRSFYTAGGHTSSTYDEPAFQSHLLGGLRYASGESPGGCDPNVSLPIELGGFGAEARNDQVIILWRTEQEKDNAGFFVEQRLDGTDEYASVGWVDGAGSTSSPQGYRFVVNTVPAGRHSYRLRQVDLDGSFWISQSVEVIVESAETFVLSSAYPNPFNATTNFDLVVAETQHVDVFVTNALGVQVASLYRGEASANRRYEFTVDAAEWANGVYLVVVKSNRFWRGFPVVLVR